MENLIMSKNIMTLPRPNAYTALIQYSRDQLGFMTRCGREYGEIVPLQFGDELFCLLTNPDHITEVFKDRLLFVKGKEVRMLQGLMGNGLITSEGDFWQRQRQLTQPMFHQQRINGYGRVMVDYTERMLQTWQEGQVLNIHDAMMHLTRDIVMKTIFGQDITEQEADNITYALDEAMNWFIMQMQVPNPGNMQTWLNLGSNIIAWVLHVVGLRGKQASSIERSYQYAITLLDETVYAMIQQRRQSGSEGDDLLGMLMQIQDADDGSRLSDQQLRDEVITIILAGHETTTNTLSWTWMLLAQHPQVYKKLFQELHNVLKGRSPTLADLPQLKYTNMVIKEAMRLYPAVTDVPREASEDCEIGGYAIPKGTTIIISQWVMHRHPRYFDAPETFNPERWENDFEKQLRRGVYFPFGDGPRACIGKGFALMEAVLLLATIAQKFQLELVPNHPIELQPFVSLRPKNGIQVVLKKV
jgi:cytochrome P450